MDGDGDDDANNVWVRLGVALAMLGIMGTAGGVRRSRC